MGEINWADPQAVLAEAARRAERRAQGLPLHDDAGPPVTSEREVRQRPAKRPRKPSLGPAPRPAAPEAWAKLGREMVEQIRLFDWVDGPEAPAGLREACYAIPNAGMRSRFLGGAMRRSGLRKGSPDLVVDLPSPRYRGLALELKVAGGTIDPAQAAVHAQWRSRGWLVEIAVGWEVARDTILRYLRDGR